MTQHHPLSAIEEAASAWFLRRRERAGDADLEQAFEAWLAESPRHRAEYERIATVWDDLAALPRPATAAVPPVCIAPVRRPAVLRWGSTFAAALLALAGAYFFVPVSYTSVANAPDQTRDLGLPDGSRLHANVGTRVTVRYTLAARHIEIDGGEVYIDAAPDRRPLIVTAGNTELRDIGTEFNVLLLPDLLQVGVRSGQVSVDPGGNSARHTLASGDTLLLARADARVLRRQHVPATEIGAWQDGVVVVHEATLQQLAGYLALYRSAPVRFADTRARGLRVSGTLDLRHPEALLDMLPGLLPVTLTRQADGAAVLASR
ncbi:FecR family protein [Pseudomonadota bacterium AL_CKDN230030165-1A_HGKHYDSX7]